MDYVTIAPVTVDVLDDWWRVVGVRLELPGGTTLRATDSPWARAVEPGEVALAVDDPYLPPFIASLTQAVLETVGLALAPGAGGPRVGIERQSCDRHRTRRDSSADRCLPCFYARWQRRVEVIRFWPRPSNG